MNKLASSVSATEALAKEHRERRNIQNIKWAAGSNVNGFFILHYNLTKLLKNALHCLLGK